LPARFSLFPKPAHFSGSIRPASGKFLLIEKMRMKSDSHWFYQAEYKIEWSAGQPILDVRQCWPTVMEVLFSCSFRKPPNVESAK
jgi:hypothetical protein